MTELDHGRERQPRFFRNDYGTLETMQSPTWDPKLIVSVVIPALGGQEKLDLVLAALSAQSYPQDLIDVVIVDDGSVPPLRLPELRPEQTRLVASSDRHWGIANAVNTGIEAADGDIILRLDSDIVPSRLHVENHARWHHVADYLMVLGTVQFIIDPETAELSPEKVAAATGAGKMGRVFAACEVASSWAAERIGQTDRLRQLEDRAYSVANGAAVSFRKDFWKDMGGLRTDLVLGEDTEFGYRFSQYGGVIIPEQGATAWHLGASTSHSRGEEANRVRTPAMANRIPMQRHLRKAVGRNWEVPFVEAVVDAEGADYESVKTTVDSLLADREADLSVTLKGSWSALSSAHRYRPLDDPYVDLRLLHQDYASEGRVVLVQDVERHHPTAPFLLSVRPGVTILPGAVVQMADLAELRRVGLVNVVVTGSEERFPVVLERTAALSRAKRLVRPDESLFDAVDAVWGLWFANGDEWAVMPGAASPAPAAPKAATEIVKLRGQLARAEAEVSRQRERAEKWKDKSQHDSKQALHWKELAVEWRAKARLRRSGGAVRSLARRVRAKLRRV